MVRLRKTDLLGLVGIALLLAWTPAYYAQDGVEQDLTGGTSFRLAPPRDGDRAILELQISERGGPVQVFGPIMEFSFHPTDGPARKAGGSFAFTTHHHPISIQTELVSYVSSGREHSIHLDHLGRLVYQTESWPSEVEEQGEMVTLHETRGSRPTDCRQPIPHEFAATTYRYDPQPHAAYLRHLRDDLIEDEHPLDGCRGSGDTRARNTLNVVAESGGNLLFGRHLLRGDRILDRYTAPTGDAPLETCRIEEGDPLIRQHGDDDHWGPIYQVSYALDDLLPTQAIEYSCDIRRPEEAWHWITAGFSYPVGAHREIFDAAGNELLKIDLVPRTLVRGDGPQIPIAEPRSVLPPRGGGDHQAPAGALPRLATVALHDLERDPPQLVHGITYDHLRSAVEGQAVPPVATLVENAYLVGYSWDAEGPRPKGGESADPIPIPIPTHPVNGPLNRTELRSSWSVTYAEEDGDAVRCDIYFSTDETTGHMQSTVRNGCADGMTTVAVTGWDRNLTDPTALLQDLPHLDAPADWVTAPPVNTKSSFSWDATGDIPTGAWSIWHLPHEGSRLVSWGRYDLTMGHLTSEWSREIVDEPLDPPTRQQGDPSTAPARVLHPIPHHVALGGVLLIAVSIFARLGSSLKTGGMTAGALAFYAKIRKDALLDHERRDTILTLIENDPGITLRELQSRLGYGWGSTVHHVETLLRNGLLNDLSLNRRRHLYPPTIPISQRRRIAAERDPELQPLLAAVQAHPGLRLRDLLNLIERPESTVSRLGSRLAALDLVEKRKVGRTVRFYPRAD